MFAQFTAFLAAWTETAKSFQLIAEKVGEFLAWQRKMAEQKIAEDIQEIRVELSKPTTSEEKDEISKKLGGVTSRL